MSLLLPSNCQCQTLKHCEKMWLKNKTVSSMMINDIRKDFRVPFFQISLYIRNIIAFVSTFTVKTKTNLTSFLILDAPTQYQIPIHFSKDMPMMSQSWSFQTASFGLLRFGRKGDLRKRCGWFLVAIRNFVCKQFIQISFPILRMIIIRTSRTFVTKKSAIRFPVTAFLTQQKSYLYFFECD